MTMTFETDRLRLRPTTPDDLTVAEVLQSHGYAAGLYGKWGLGDEGNTGRPNDQGFDEFFGYLNPGFLIT